MMAGQVHIGVPATGDGERTAMDLLSTTTGKADIGMADPQTPACTADDRAGKDLGDLALRGVGAGIDDGRHIDTGGGKVGGGPVPVIIVGKDGDMLGRGGGKAVHIAAYRAGLHDARPVIVGKADQPFGGAGAQQRAPGIDAPQDLPRLASVRRGDMVAGAFQHGMDAMVEHPDGGASRHQPHIGKALQFGHHSGGPVGTRHAADTEALLKQPAAGTEILVDEDHLGTGASGGQRRRQPGRSGPDHQQVAMAKSAVIDIRIVLAGQRAKAGCAPDDRLVDTFPEGFRPHEGLVVEACAEKVRQPVIDRHQIESKRREPVLASGDQPVMELGHGDPAVRLAAGAGAKLDKAVRLFRSGRNNAARTVIFERASDKPHAVGDQRRGERVAGKAAITPPVKGEAERCAAVDQAAVKTVHLGHFALRPEAMPAATSAASSTFSTSWVTVSRVTISQLRSPISWYHSSRCAPAGLSRRY